MLNLIALKVPLILNSKHINWILYCIWNTKSVKKLRNFGSEKASFSIILDFFSHSQAGIHSNIYQKSLNIKQADAYAAQPHLYPQP